MAVALGVGHGLDEVLTRSHVLIDQVLAQATDAVELRSFLFAEHQLGVATGVILDFLARRHLGLDAGLL